jgi:hypothetical protein
MSRRGWLVAPFSLALTPVLWGQSLPSLQARADSLAREWRRANAVAEAVDSLERTRALAGRDTIRVGALTIVANPSSLPLREAAARAWPVIDSLYGSEAQQLKQRPYVIVAVDPDTTIERPVIRGGMEVRQNQDVAALTLLLLSAVPIAPLDTAWQSWLGGSLPPAIRAEQQRAGVYVQLVTAPSQAVRRCFLGDTAACRDALGLVTTADPLARWYPGAQDRRSLVVKTFGAYFDREAHRPALQACAKGSDSACTQLLRSLPGGVPRPLTYDARATLVQVALRLGGREAYHRLVASVGQPIADRVARAAGIGVDSLISRWRAEILASRPRPVSLPRWGIWVALGWTAIFAACGLRSSRWRVS